MKLETFFEKFELFLEAPGAVEKLRELVLELAVRGKLISQNTRDEPAEKLANKISEERTSFVKTNKLIRQRTIDAVTDDEYPFALPSGWIWTRLGNLCRVQAGFAFASSGFVQSDSGLPIIRIRDIANDHTQVNYVGDYRDEFLVDAGDYVVGMDGNFRVAKWRGPRALLNQRVSRLQWYSNRLEPFFLAIATQHRLKELQGRKSYTTVDHLSSSQIENTVVPLPPIIEQKKIVAKLNELMALCDQLEAQQQKREAQRAKLTRASLARFAEEPTPANLTSLFHPSYSITPADLRKSILTLAVQGKLVPRDLNDEPADNLLKRSLDEQRRLKRIDTIEVQPLSTENALGYEIPESWRWQRLDNLLISGPTNGFSPKAVDYETPVRSLTLSATTSGQFKGEHSKFIDTDIPANSDLWLRDGDILVQRGNTIDYVGVSAVYRGERNSFIYPDLMMKLRLSSAFDVDFIHIAMSHEAARDFLRSRASGTSGSMPKINQTTLKSLPIPIPPLSEQRRIVIKVDQLMSLVGHLEKQLVSYSTTVKKLLEAIVVELTTEA
jgi:type I restriction enzyme, S subunit